MRLTLKGEFRCECGRVFRSKNWLANHQNRCAVAATSKQASELQHIAEICQRAGLEKVSAKLFEIARG